MACCVILKANPVEYLVLWTAVENYGILFADLWLLVMIYVYIVFLSLLYVKYT